MRKLVLSIATIAAFAGVALVAAPALAAPVNGLGTFAGTSG
jgi:hypothetical protein